MGKGREGGCRAFSEFCMKTSILFIKAYLLFFLLLENIISIKSKIEYEFHKILNFVPYQMK